MTAQPSSLSGGQRKQAGKHFFQTEHSLSVAVWKLVAMQLSHGRRETVGLLCCAPQTFVSHPHLEMNEGSVWGCLPSMISVKPHGLGSLHNGEIGA